MKVDHEAADKATEQLGPLRVLYVWMARLHGWVLALFMILRIAGVIQTSWPLTVLIMAAIVFVPFVVAVAYGGSGGWLMGRFMKRRREESGAE